MGIEPTLSAWEADALPLSYTRVATAYPGSEAARQQTSLEYSTIILVQRGIFVNHKGGCFPAFFKSPPNFPAPMARYTICCGWPAAQALFFPRTEGKGRGSIQGQGGAPPCHKGVMPCAADHGGVIGAEAEVRAVKGQARPLAGFL